MSHLEYSKKVMDNFMNPKNLGEIPNPDGVGKLGNPSCGDIMVVTIKVDKTGKKLKDVKFKTFGCGAAIATASMVTQLAKGKTLEEAKKLTNKKVADELGGLPPIKMHCSNMAASTLKKAIEDYEKRSKQI